MSGVLSSISSGVIGTAAGGSTSAGFGAGDRGAFDLSPAPQVRALVRFVPISDQRAPELLLAAVGAALWDGCKRIGELQIERQQLVENAERAEAAARFASETAQKLAKKMAMVLEYKLPDRAQPEQTPVVNGGGEFNGGMAHATPYSVVHGTPALATPRSDAPRTATPVPSLSRDELVKRGRNAFERHLLNVQTRELSRRTPGETPGTGSVAR